MSDKSEILEHELWDYLSKITSEHVWWRNRFFELTAQEDSCGDFNAASQTVWFTLTANLFYYQCLSPNLFAPVSITSYWSSLE